jgi:predicted ester cyclase
MTMTETAREFFEACETGKGWGVCSQYCTADATFSAQAEALSEIHTLQDYTGWTKGILTPLPDGGYELKSFAIDEGRGNACAYAIFSGTHTGEGGPVPPTGKTVHTDYVYVMQFEGDKIAHMTKIWNSNVALKQLGWG